MFDYIIEKRDAMISIPFVFYDLVQEIIDYGASGISGYLIEIAKF